MKTVFALAAAFVLGAASPVFAQARDTGSMAFPQPLPQGNVATTTAPRTSSDTGSMAFPAPGAPGAVGGGRAGGGPADTGSMAFPAPQPQGTVGAAPTK